MSQQARPQQALGRRILIGVLTVLVALVLYWWQSGSGDDQAEQADRSSSPSSTSSNRSGSGDPGDSGERGSSGLPVIEESALPVEARDTLRAIDDGGPYRYDRDGVVFENREGLLPDGDYGYYHEYTVTTPGSDDRGARRIVTGGDVGAETEFYWTSDHYQSFEEIRR